MKTTIITLLVIALAGTSDGQTFNDFITRVNVAPADQRTAIVDSFMQAVGEFPYIERDTVCHFVYRGDANSVTVPGDANQWTATASPMSRLSTTDLWYVTQNFERDARLDYKFVLNTSNWILDPRNPHTCTGGFGPNSELRMPGYVPAPEIEYYADIPHGALRDTMFTSQALRNTRRVRIYTPPGYDATTGQIPMILFHDGLEYITLANANNVLDYLIAHHRLQPVIGVFVPPVDRAPEYAGNLQPQFTTFIVNELLPFVFANYRVKSPPEYHATLGASDGGNISLWLGASHPEVFGRVAAHSSDVQPNITSILQSDSVLNLQFYLDIGTYDIDILIPMVHNLRDLLQQRGYVYRFNEYHEGHSWGNWRAHMKNALEMFFPGDSVAAVSPRTEMARDFALNIFPNPFNSRTTIAFELPVRERVQILLYDLTGRQVRVLEDATREAGSFQVSVDSAGLASGIYFVELKTREVSLCRKIVLLK